MCGGNDGWQNDRVEITYEEARSVLEAQNDTMADIDTKAMRTVRFDVLLIGLLVGAAQVSGPDVFHTGSLLLAVGAFLTSILLGVGTYNESNLYLGPDGPYVESHSQGSASQNRWDLALLQLFAGMISENSNRIERNSWLLTWTLGTLALGVVCSILTVLI